MKGLDDHAAAMPCPSHDVLRNPVLHLQSRDSTERLRRCALTCDHRTCTHYTGTNGRSQWPNITITLQCVVSRAGARRGLTIPEGFTDGRLTPGAVPSILFVVGSGLTCPFARLPAGFGSISPEGHATFLFSASIHFRLRRIGLKPGGGIGSSNKRSEDEDVGLDSEKTIRLHYSTVTLLCQWFRYLRQVDCRGSTSEGD